MLFTESDERVSRAPSETVSRGSEDASDNRVPVTTGGLTASSPEAVTPIAAMMNAGDARQFTVTTPDKKILISAPRFASRPVARPHVPYADATARFQPKHKRRRTDDPYHRIVSAERQKLRLEVRKLRHEVNKLQMDSKLTELLYYKETLQVRKLERDMRMPAKTIEPVGCAVVASESDGESDDCP